LNIFFIQYFHRQHIFNFIDPHGLLPLTRVGINQGGNLGNQQIHAGVVSGQAHRKIGGIQIIQEAPGISLDPKAGRTAGGLVFQTLHFP
jgi:hypothetical protein